MMDPDKRIGWEIYNALVQMEKGQALDMPMPFDFFDLKDKVWNYFNLGEEDE